MAADTNATDLSQKPRVSFSSPIPLTMATVGPKIASPANSTTTEAAATNTSAVDTTDQTVSPAEAGSTPSSSTPIEPAKAKDEPAKADSPKDEKKDDKAPADADKIGAKFAALSRKERQVVAQQQEIKVEQAKLAEAKAKLDSEASDAKAKFDAERSAFATKQKEYDDWQALKKSNPLQAFEALGFTYQQLTDMVLNDGKMTPEQIIEAKTKELDAKFEAYTKAQEEKAAQAAKAAEEQRQKDLEDEKSQTATQRAESIKKFHVEIGDFVKSNPDDYQLINVNYEPEQASEIIYATINQKYQDTLKEGTPVVLSVKEASDLFEKHLEVQIARNLATKKLSAKVSPPASPAAPNADTKVTPQKTPATSSSQTKTLNNGMTASSLSSAATSDAERMKRALAVMNSKA